MFTIMPTTKAILATTLNQRCPRGRTAVFATGGLDSTALACLIRASQPQLIFGAVQDSGQHNYTTSAINACQKISTLLELNLTVVPITGKAWLKSFLHLAQTLKTPMTDTDLPAAALLFQKARDLGLNTALSGMGSDNIFNLPKKQLTTFIRSEGISSLKVHADIAKLHDITFVCPFLEKPMLDHALSTPLKARQGKKALLAIFKDHPPLLELMRNRTPAHSIIPLNFLLPLKALLKKTPPTSNPVEIFTQAAMLAWQHFHPSSAHAHRPDA